jgi:Tol biopolymer transport system component
MDIDGNDIKRLTESNIDKGRPLWSPNGKHIAYQVYADFGKIQIHVMNADGSEDRDVSTGVTKDKKTHPAWSPDGSKLAFVSMKTYGEQHIYVVNADGSNPVNLTNNPFANLMPTWSPDGKRIAFVSNREGSRIEQAAGEIFVMNADGSGAINLTKNPYDDSDPMWSANGAELYFLSLRDGNAHLFSVNTAGGTTHRLTTHAGHDLMYRVAPNHVMTRMPGSQNQNLALN